MKKIKVLTFSPDLPDAGGVGRVVFSLNQYYSDNIENKVVVINYCDSLIIRLKKMLLKQNIEKPLKSKDSKILVVNHKRNLLSRFLSEQNHQQQLYKKLEKKLRIEDFDLIHGHYVSGPGKCAVYLANKYHKKSIVTFHGSDVINFDKNMILDCADYITYVSHYLKQSVNEKFDLESSKQSVIYNGIDSTVFNLKNREDERVVIAYAGRLHKIKGVHHLKQIFKQLDVFRKENNLSILFHIYGDGPERELLEKYFKFNNIDVEFYGNISAKQLAHKFQKVKVMIVPSEQEGYSCIVPEAKACGAYIVATNVGGLPESIGSIGTLINKDNQFIENMVSDIKNRYLQQIRVEDIAKDVSNDWRKITLEYEHIYKKIIK